MLTTTKSVLIDTCPPPDGMVEGNCGTAREIFPTEQDIEQECLFYVALSRARDRLFLYAPTQKSNGVGWGLSPFLARLEKGLNRRARYARSSPARGAGKIKVARP